MLVDLLVELFLDGVVDAAGNTKLPLRLRILSFSFLCFIAIGISIFCAFWFYETSGITGIILGGSISIVLIVLWLYGCSKIRKKHSKN